MPSVDIGPLQAALAMAGQVNAQNAQARERERIRRAEAKGNTIRTIGTVGGAIVGGIYGGAPGAAAGASLGGALGGSVGSAMYGSQAPSAGEYANAAISTANVASAQDAKTQQEQNRAAEQSVLRNAIGGVDQQTPQTVQDANSYSRLSQVFGETRSPDTVNVAGNTVMPGETTQNNADLLGEAPAVPTQDQQAYNQQQQTRGILSAALGSSSPIQEAVKGLQLRQALAKQGPSPVILAEKAQLVDPTTGKVIAENLGDATGAAVQQKQSLANTYRKELLDQSKTFNVVSENFQNIQKGVQAGTAQGDISSVFGIMKMYDPNSVVRETEYATAKNAAGVPDVIRNQWNQLKDGQFLSAKQRGDILNRAQDIYETQYAKHMQIVDDYAKRAETHGIPRSEVVVSLIQQTPEQAREILNKFSSTIPDNAQTEKEQKEAVEKKNFGAMSDSTLKNVKVKDLSDAEKEKLDKELKRRGY